MGLCEYSTALGVPGEGVHSYRVGGLAAADLLGAAGLAWLLARYGLREPSALAFVLVFLLVIACACLVHAAFCVDTRLNAALLGRAWPGPGTAPAPAPAPARKIGTRAQRRGTMG